MSVREGINAAISEEIERDPDVFLMGKNSVLPNKLIYMNFRRRSC